MNPYELDRNDVAGAAALYREALARGAAPEELGELVHVLYMLQDEPKALEAALRAVREERGA